MTPLSILSSNETNTTEPTFLLRFRIFFCTGSRPSPAAVPGVGGIPGVPSEVVRSTGSALAPLRSNAGGGVPFSLGRSEEAARAALRETPSTAFGWFPAALALALLASGLIGSASSPSAPSGFLAFFFAGLFASASGGAQPGGGAPGTTRPRIPRPGAGAPFVFGNGDEARDVPDPGTCRARLVVDPFLEAVALYPSPPSSSRLNIDGVDEPRAPGGR